MAKHFTTLQHKLSDLTQQYPPPPIDRIQVGTTMSRLIEVMIIVLISLHPTPDATHTKSFPRKQPQHAHIPHTGFSSSERRAALNCPPRPILSLILIPIKQRSRSISLSHLCCLPCSRMVGGAGSAAKGDAPQTNGTEERKAKLGGLCWLTTSAVSAVKSAMRNPNHPQRTKPKLRVDSQATAFASERESAIYMTCCQFSHVMLHFRVCRWLMVDRNTIILMLGYNRFIIYFLCFVLWGLVSNLIVPKPL